METQNYYLKKIKEDLSVKQKNNPHFSMRAYAKLIGLHPRTLTQALSIQQVF